VLCFVAHIPHQDLFHNDGLYVLETICCYIKRQSMIIRGETSPSYLEAHSSLSAFPANSSFKATNRLRFPRRDLSMCSIALLIFVIGAWASLQASSHVIRIGKGRARAEVGAWCGPLDWQLVYMKSMRMI